MCVMSSVSLEFDHGRTDRSSPRRGRVLRREGRSSAETAIRKDVVLVIPPAWSSALRLTSVVFQLPHH
jgi:hypothetical protein